MAQSTHAPLAKRLTNVNRMRRACEHLTRWLRVVGGSVVVAGFVVGAMGGASQVDVAYGAESLSAVPEFEAQSGEELMRLGRFQDAAMIFLQDARGAETRGDREQQTASLIQAARAFQEIGHYQKADDILTVAHARIDQEHRLDVRIGVLEALGDIQFGLGRGAKGMKFYNEALGLAREAGRTDLSAALLNSLGNVLTSSHRNTQAIAAYTESAVLAEATGHQELELIALINSVRAATQQGLRRNAEDRLDLAFLKASGADDSYGNVRRLLNIGIYYLRLDPRAPYATVASQVSSSAPLEGSRGRERGVTVEQGEGPAELEEVVVPEIAPAVDRREYEHRFSEAITESVSDTAQPKSLRIRAAEAFQAAAHVARRLGDVRSESYAWGHLGELYEAEKRYDDALELTRRAVTFAQQAGASEALYRWHWQTARLQRALGQFDASRAAYRRAIASLQPIRHEVSVAYHSRQHSFRAGVGPIFFQLADLLLAESRVTDDQALANTYMIEARDTIEQFKAAELQDYFQDDCVQQAQSLEKTLSTVAPQTAILYPIMLPDRLELLVNYASAIKQYTVPLGSAVIEAQITRLRRGLQHVDDSGYLTEAQALYDTLIRPADKDLEAEQVDTLVIVPDGLLRTIPFAVLHDRQQHLIERYALATTPGLTLTDPHPIDRSNVNVLSLGLTESVQGFPALPYVDQELDTIQALYGGVRLLDKDFHIDNVRNHIQEEDFSIVHIASHGLVERNVEDTFLLAYDNKITMNKLADLVGMLKYRKTPLELLTLSACETAAGDDRAALGLAGVAIKAGARSALATLWYIDDQVASDLVGEFYRQLQNADLTKAQALQRAQVKVLEHPDYRHPNFWSPFLLINNWL